MGLTFFAIVAKLSVDIFPEKKNEQYSVSGFTKLGNEVDFEDFNEYEKYLVFQDKDNVQCAYLYESDDFYRRTPITATFHFFLYKSK